VTNRLVLSPTSPNVAPLATFKFDCGVPDWILGETKLFADELKGDADVAESQ